MLFRDSSAPHSAGAMPPTFAPHDRVRHASKPEWGVGDVLEATPAVQNGAPCQRLRVRFEGAGVKVLSTAFADLRPAGTAPPTPNGPPSTTPPQGDGGWLDALEAGDLDARLHRLPEETTDPFRSLEDRLKATLALYRHEPRGGPLIDWASIQTGLRDPLAQRNRQELESAFERYAHAREQHLAALLRTAVRTDPEAGRRALAGAPQAGKAAAERLLARR